MPEAANAPKVETAQPKVEIIALTWWNQRKNDYPIHRVTTDNKKYNPSTLNAYIKEANIKRVSDYISTGVQMDGKMTGRIWGFKRQADADQFKNIIGSMR